MNERDQDDEALAEMGAERYEMSLEAIYHAAMRGLPDDLVRHLLAECGINYAELERYVPMVLRMPKRKGEAQQEQRPFR